MREKILKILKHGQPVSGEQLGRQLNISRTAVWKHIQELRKKGYIIDSSTRVGYTLVRSVDLLVPEEITSELPTRFIGQHVVYYKEVTSTQEIAHQLAKKGGEEGLAVVAEKQTQGKGRKGKTWVSPEGGGIYVSLILRPDLLPVHVVQIPLVIGIAVAKSISKILPLHPRIKWPNDIYIGSKKVAGILTEMNSELDRVNYIIPGIGINVNTRIANLPESVKDIATSLADEYGQVVSRQSLIRQFFIELEAVYVKFVTFGFSSVRNQWKALNNTLGYQVRVFDQHTELSGKAVDIDDEGFLLIKKADGNMEKIIGGEVSLVRREP